MTSCIGRQIVAKFATSIIEIAKSKIHEFPGSHLLSPLSAIGRQCTSIGHSGNCQDRARRLISKSSSSFRREKKPQRQWKWTAEKKESQELRVNYSFLAVYVDYVYLSLFWLIVSGWALQVNQEARGKIISRAPRWRTTKRAPTWWTNWNRFFSIDIHNCTIWTEWWPFDKQKMVLFLEIKQTKVVDQAEANSTQSKWKSKAKWTQFVLYSIENKNLS